MLLTDGLTNILNGTPSSDDTSILDTVGQELENYSGSKLSLTPSSSCRTAVL
jgi:hypothetical protein